jgi:hypothetical protein
MLAQILFLETLLLLAEAEAERMVKMVLLEAQAVAVEVEFIMAAQERLVKDLLAEVPLMIIYLVVAVALAPLVEQQ